MIAAQQIAYEPRRTEPRRVERVRTATRRRTRRTRRRMHKPLFAVVTLAVAVLLPLLAYVFLTAGLTSTSYALARAERDRTVLLEDTQRLDERIARLKSPERLAAIAASLKMHDPHVYAVVTLPEVKPQPRPTGLAILAEWFGAR